jgi:hypothetical protein
VLADSLNWNGFKNAEESFEKVESSARGSPRRVSRGWFSSSDNVGSAGRGGSPYDGRNCFRIRRVDRS